MRSINMDFELKPFETYAQENGVTVRKDLEELEVKSELQPMLKKQFLKFYEQCGLLEEAAQSCGINTATVLTWRNEDPQFKIDYDNTKDSFVTLLEDQAMKMAMSGKQPLMIMFLLKANNPEKYDDKARNPAQAANINIQVTDVGGGKLVDTSAPPKALPLVVEGELVNAEKESNS